MHTILPLSHNVIKCVDGSVLVQLVSLQLVILVQSFLQFLHKHFELPRFVQQRLMSEVLDVLPIVERLVS